MSHLTLTDRLRTALTQACAAIDAWNQAVSQARAREDRNGCPGRYEYKILTDKAHGPMHLACSHGLHTLDLAEDTVRCCGFSSAALYAALGRTRPTVEPQGPHVADWQKAQR